MQDEISEKSPAGRAKGDGDHQTAGIMLGNTIFEPLCGINCIDGNTTHH